MAIRGFNKQSSIIYQVPQNLQFLDEEDEKRKCQEFKDDLVQYQRELGNDNFKVPSIGGKELDLCKLYKAVYVRGGSVQVSTRKLWKEIVNEFQIPSSCTSASFTLRNHYNKCLLAYETRWMQQHHPEALRPDKFGGGQSGGPGPGRPVGSGNVNSSLQTGQSYGSPIMGGNIGQTSTHNVYGAGVHTATPYDKAYPPYQTSTYKELGPQNIFATTQVAHHTNPSGMIHGGLGLALGQQFGSSHLQQQSNQNQQSQIHGGHSNMNKPPLISSISQNYKFNQPNHLQSYQQQIVSYQKMQGRVQSAIGGNLHLNSNPNLGFSNNQLGPFDKHGHKWPGQHHAEKAQANAQLHQQINQISSAASLNYKASNNYTLKVQLSQTEAESKRLVLAFESRQTSEINWALNTLTIFSCNTNQNFTLENQPYLLESLANYMVYCVQNIESFSYSNPMEKRGKIMQTNVPSFIDAFQGQSYQAIGATSNSMDVQQQSELNLDYKNYGSYTKDFKKRDFKFDEKQAAKRGVQDSLGKNGAANTTNGGSGIQRQRGRKPIYIKQQEQNALDELRKKRKKLVTILHQEVTEMELIEHLRQIVVIIRNLTFVRSNEHHVIKCFKLVDIITSLFVDLIDHEITTNCLDIITNIAKHIVLSDINCGQQLVQSLFVLFSSSSFLAHEHLYASQTTVDQCIECLRRLSLSAGNEEFLEQITDKQIQSLINLLLSKNLETREGCLEILCTISDRKTTLKTRMASQKRCIERLIGLIATGSQTPNEEKISKLAALTLANLNLAPLNRQLIVPYEQELALIASSDEKTCKIISEILGDLDSYQVYAK